MCRKYKWKKCTERDFTYMKVNLTSLVFIRCVALGSNVYFFDEWQMQKNMGSILKHFLSKFSTDIANRVSEPFADVYSG